MSVKFYAVRTGLKPGIYKTWDECKSNTMGYPGAVFKSFPTEKEALEFLKGHTVSESECPDKTSENVPYAFVDGSFNTAEGVYGYGGFLCVEGEKYVLKGSGNEPDMASMRNVAGEILGSMAAIEKALELGLDRICIYYDYMGIEMWAKGVWKRNKKGTAAYYDYIQTAKNRISIEFVKVKGHSGIEGNEEADRLAKEAAGIEK